MLSSCLKSPVLSSQLSVSTASLCTLQSLCGQLFKLDQVKCPRICFSARNSEGCQARILVLELPKQSSLMLSTGTEHHLGLILTSRKTFELFQTELFPSLVHHYKACELPYCAEPGCISGLQSQQEEQLFGSLGNSAVQENQTKHLNALKLVRQQSDF